MLTCFCHYIFHATTCFFSWPSCYIVPYGTRLVGGLYGVTLRNAFFGESMFSLVPNASKLALIHLAKALQAIGGHFIDCQFETPLFESMGGTHIPYDKYMELLGTIRLTECTNYQEFNNI